MSLPESWEWSEQNPRKNGWYAVTRENWTKEKVVRIASAQFGRIVLFSPFVSEKDDKWTPEEALPLEDMHDCLWYGPIKGPEEEAQA